MVDFTKIPGDIVVEPYDLPRKTPSLRLEYDGRGGIRIDVETFTAAGLSAEATETMLADFNVSQGHRFMGRPATEPLVVEVQQLFNQWLWAVAAHGVLRRIDGEWDYPVRTVR